VNRSRLPYLLCATVSLGTASLAAASKPQTLQYEVKMKSLSFGDMGTRRMYIKGEKMRWEGKTADLPILVIKNSEGAFLIHPWQKIAAKYPASSNRNNPRAYIPGPTGSPKAFLAQLKAVRCGREKVERQTCDVYSYYEPATDRHCKLWLGVKSGKPVRLVLQGINKRKDTIVATYTKFILGGPAPDSLFQLPKGYAVRPMPEPKLTSEQQAPRTGAREPLS